LWASCCFTLVKILGAVIIFFFFLAHIVTDFISSTAMGFNFLGEFLGFFD
jgi:hypothetical protein